MTLADLRKLAPGESPACSWRTETIMAKQVEECTIGVDVAKGWLDIYVADQGDLERIDNTEEAIEVWLRGLSGPIRIAVEATNRYHELLIERAYEQGHRVYVIDAFKCTECVGAHDEPQCQPVCPVDDCIVPNPDFRETEEELLQKYEQLNG